MQTYFQPDTDPDKDEASAILAIIIIIAASILFITN